MTTIDPVEFGQLQAKVDALEKKVDSMAEDIKSLLELANRSKGALWFGMGLAAGLGAALHWAIDRMVK